MSEETIYVDDSGSICQDCTHMVSRLIIPYDFEEFGLTEADLIDDDGNMQPILHNTCTVLGFDLNHIVLSCNKYKRVGSVNSIFFTDNPVYS